MLAVSPIGKPSALLFVEACTSIMKILVLNSGSSIQKVSLYEIGGALPEEFKGIARKEKLNSRVRASSATRGTIWTTDKGRPIMNLLAAEITARTGKDPGVHYLELTAEFGSPFYSRIDAQASPEQKGALQRLSPDSVKESELAGEPIVTKLTEARGNHAPIGGLKVLAKSGWFTARPSGTENIYKIYAESFNGEAHLNATISEAQEMVSNALG